MPTVDQTAQCTLMQMHCLYNIQMLVTLNNVSDYRVTNYRTYELSESIGLLGSGLLD